MTVLDHTLEQKNKDMSMCPFSGVFICQVGGLYIICVLNIVSLYYHFARSQDDGAPMAFRYGVTPLPKINAFDPKGVSPDQNLMDLRPTVFGAVYKGHFRKLPTSMATVTWEALDF